MPKLNPVLRLLVLVCVLVFLIGWVGMVAQPSEAQQTVTLSGRVTDSAGQAVSDTYVFLDRLPEGISAGEQHMDGNGAYRLSAPPGTHLLRVRYQPRPLFDPRVELTLLTNATRNIVLEAGVTLSGWMRRTRPSVSMASPVCWRVSASHRCRS